MASLAEVQAALKQGDKQKAAQLLKAILKEHPSADAWVMAARLSSNPASVRHHLQRALSFDPNHRKARDMLRDLGGGQKTSLISSGGLGQEIHMGLEHFGQNSRLLGRLSPQQRMVTAIGLFVVIFAVVISLPGILFSPGPTPSPMPEALVMVILQSEPLVNHLTTSLPNITSIESVPPGEGVTASEQLKLVVQDAAGSHDVTVYLYADVGAMVADSTQLNALTQSAKVAIYETAVMFYPPELETGVATALEAALSSVPVT